MNVPRPCPTLCAILGGACILLAGCSKHVAEVPLTATQPRVPVRVIVAATNERAGFEETVGTIRARLRASIEAKVSARIEKMAVVPGQAVRTGEILTQLDAREIQSRMDQAVPVLRNAETEMKRFKSLLEQNAVSVSEYDALEARYRVALAAVTEAETTLGHTKVMAPFDGVITRKLADVGDLATPGRALLEIEDPSSLRLEADVPESLISRLQLGMKLRIGLDGNALEGKVSEIAPAADSSTRTFLVKVDLPPEATLRAGQFARLAIPLASRPALLVPSSAVLQRGQMELLFVATGDKAELRLVKTARKEGDQVEIVSGIAPGERIITEKVAQLRDGQPIEVTL